MFKLIKLAVYGLIGYGLYQFIRGLTEGESALQAAGLGEGGRGGRSRDLNRALDDSTSGRMNMTGPGAGARVTTNEASGGAIPHTVGRGVVHG